MPSTESIEPAKPSISNLHTGVKITARTNQTKISKVSKISGISNIRLHPKFKNWKKTPFDFVYQQKELLKFDAVEN